MITVEEIKEYSKQGISTLSDFVDQLYEDGISKNQYYKDLWYFIMDDSNFSGYRAKSVAILIALRQKRFHI